MLDRATVMSLKRRVENAIHNKLISQVNTPETGTGSY